MAYEHRRIGRQRLLYNNSNDDNALVYQLVVDGAKVIPTACTFAIFKPGVETAVVAAAAASPGITGTLIKHTVDTTTTSNFPVDTGFRADLEVSYNSKTYTRHLIFDVTKYYFDLAISFDQLVALDGEIRGMHNDGDEDFSNMIDAVADEIQSDIETKIIKGDMLLQNMILDNSRVMVAARRRMLSQIWLNKGNDDKREYNWKLYETMLASSLSSQKFDTDQDGFEDDTPGGITPIVLHK